MELEGGDLAFAEVGAVAIASCAKGREGRKEELGVEQRKRDQQQGSLLCHVIWLWVHSLVSAWCCQKCTFATWEGDTLTH